MRLKRWLLLLPLLCAGTLSAQSYLFISPNVRDHMSAACAHDSLESFEEQNFLAVARLLAGKACKAPKISASEGLFEGQVENSGMVEGCTRDQAAYVGALLSRYYHQEFELVFTPDSNGPEHLLVLAASKLSTAEIFAQAIAMGVKGMEVDGEGASRRATVWAQDETILKQTQALA